VNEPASLVCALERLIVRVSPLAIADSVELDANARHNNNGAKTARANAGARDFGASDVFCAGKFIPSATIQWSRRRCAGAPEIDLGSRAKSRRATGCLCRQRHMMAKKRGERQRRWFNAFGAAHST
jgi:hypothetical protein